MPVVRPAARQAAIAARRSPVAAAMVALLMAGLLPKGWREAT
jgi:hypothetical protein